MIPQPIVSRSVSRAISAETTVDERASIPCLRHHGYASASQIVSIPASSMTRADASISSSGSIVSCMTPIRNGGDMSRRPYTAHSTSSGGQLGMEALDREADPLRRVPARVRGADLLLELRLHLVGRRPAAGCVPHAVADVLQVAADLPDQLRAGDLAVAGDDHTGREVGETVQDADPAAASHVAVAGREDRE